MQLSTESQIDDLLRGVDLMSAGGGGNPVVQRGWLLDDLESGRVVGWEPFAPQDDGWYFTAAFTGASTTVSIPKEGASVARPMLEAICALRDHLQVEIAGLIPIELGGANTSALLDVAAQLGLPLTDADFAGRAIPSLPTSTLSFHGHSSTPGFFADYHGNRLIFAESGSDALAERIGKYLAIATGGEVAWAVAPVLGRDLAPLVVPGSVSRAYDLGRIVREAREAGNAPLDAMVEHLGGALAFRGVVSADNLKVEDYLEGTLDIIGTDQFTGQTMRLWVRNELHASWLDGEAYIASPDLLEVCDPSTGEPMHNGEFGVGAQIAVVASPRSAVYDTPPGRRALSPRHLGLDEDFPLIEDVITLAGRTTSAGR